MHRRRRAEGWISTSKRGAVALRNTRSEAAAPLTSQHCGAVMPRRPLSSADVHITVADLHDRVVRNLHECGLALTLALSDRSNLDEDFIEAVATALDVLEAVVRDIHTTAFAVRQQRVAPPTDVGSNHRRYLVRIEDEALVAYAQGDGHDFRRMHDDTIWAHESDGLLLSARSGTPIARRSGIVYYDMVNDIPLYYRTP